GTLLIANWDSIKAFLTGAWNAISQTAMAVWGGLKTWLVTTWQAIRANAEEIWGRILQFIRQFPDKAKNFLSTLPEKMAYWVGYAIGRVIAFFRDLPGNVARWVSTMAQRVSAWFQRTKDWAIARVTALYNSVTGWFRSLPGKISAFLESLPGRVRDLFNRVKDRAISAANNLYEGVRDAITRVPRIFSDIWEKIWGTITSWPSKLWRKAKDIAGSFWEGFKKGLGISSPSYVERAFMAIGAQAEETMAQLRSIAMPMRHIMARTVRPLLAADVSLPMSIQPVLPDLALAGVGVPVQPERQARHLGDSSPRRLVLEVPIYLNRREIVRAIIDDVDEEMARRQLMDQRARGVVM
ncbi:MAG TPA: hypothetical protein VIK75_07660, partial [Calditerricola sp.]